MHSSVFSPRDVALHTPFQKMIIGVAWLVLLTSEVTQALLTLKEKRQISRLPAYVSSTASVEDAQCQLQYECTRCLPLENKPLTACSSPTARQVAGIKCEVQTEIMAKEQKVKICTPKMDKICPEKPCPTCPIFCQPLNQVWCEDDFKVGLRKNWNIWVWKT